jgi:hypothetical protein
MTDTAASSASDETTRSVSRRLRDLVEPIAANVYFAPEARDRYRALGLSYGPGYFCSRAACMGQVPGEVVVAAFGVFSPNIVLPSVADGWAHTDAPTVLEARQAGAVASLQRLLGDGSPAVIDGLERATELLRLAGDAATGEGRPLYSGLRSLGWPDDPWGDFWRAADLVREHRGDSHTNAWVASGVDAAEITLLTERWWRIPVRSYAPTRGWNDAELDQAEQGLRDRGLITDDGFTPDGEKLRRDIEHVTDQGERRIVAALGADADELFALLEPWAAAIVSQGGYPADPSKLTRR